MSWQNGGGEIPWGWAQPFPTPCRVTARGALFFRALLHLQPQFPQAPAWFSGAKKETGACVSSSVANFGCHGSGADAVARSQRLRALPWPVAFLSLAQLGCTGTCFRPAELAWGGERSPACPHRRRARCHSIEKSQACLVMPRLQFEEVFFYFGSGKIYFIIFFFKGERMLFLFFSSFS